MLHHVLVPIHRAGWPFIAIFLAVSLLLGWFVEPLLWLGLLATAWCVYFFRDPHRVTPLGEGLVVSPADGCVEAVTAAVPPPELGLGADSMTRISVFLSVFDVHVNRMPIGGRVLVSHYHKGKFLNAALDKASEENERQSLLVELADGRRLGVVQIAGLVARRIICEAVEGAVYETGERFGLIRFGSRLDVYLPSDVAPLVVVGQRAVAGETILADMNLKGPAREGRRG